MPTTSPLAALFDMDGVIVDNTAYHIDTWFTFARNYGVPLSREQYMTHLNGRVSKDSFEYVFGRSLTTAEVAEFAAQKEAMYRDAYRPHRQPMPGLVDFLDELRANNVSMAVGTSAPPVNIAFTLDEQGLRPYFDVVVDASMIERGKPDPEIYLTAAARLGMEPARCVVFEDAWAGIEAGLRAGMKVVALATTHTADELVSTGVSLIIQDFSEINYLSFSALLAE